jgi:hypothetical protein
MRVHIDESGSIQRPRRSIIWHRQTLTGPDETRDAAALYYHGCVQEGLRRGSVNEADMLEDKRFGGWRRESGMDKRNCARNGRKEKRDRFQGLTS